MGDGMKGKCECFVSMINTERIKDGEIRMNCK